MQLWRSYLLFALAALILSVGVWMVVAKDDLNGLAAVFFGLFNMLIAILALVRSK